MIKTLTRQQQRGIRIELAPPSNIELFKDFFLKTQAEW